MIIPPVIPNTESATSTTCSTSMSSSCSSKISVPRTLSRSPSADRIRSRFLHKIGIDSPQTCVKNERKPNVLTSGTNPSALHNDLTPASSSAVRECILRLEPLKIALESDDESSIGSQSDSFDDGDHFSSDFTPADTTVNDDYFHKKPYPQRGGCETSSSSPQEIESISLERQIQDSSSHSLPSLATSDESQSLSNTLGSSSHSSSNKKPRFFRGQDKSRRKKKSVSIHKSVSVISIPSRYEYPNRLRDQMWTNAVEIQRNAARNTIEFCSESWKWENVLEDEHMFIHQTTKELVHPIHVQNALSQIQSANGVNNEEVQINLHLISSLVPPASAAPPSSLTMVSDDSNLSNNQLTPPSDSAH